MYEYRYFYECFLVVCPAFEMTAPIVLFVFARPEHTRRTLTALAANKLAEQSELIIYADAGRNRMEEVQVALVRRQLDDIVGFKQVTVIRRENNFGLAKNIIEGVTEVCNQYGRVIVVEDDLITSPYFLQFMNAALERYQNNPEVWHISGWNYPIDSEGLGDSFFWRVMNCWGWATWADRWKHYQKNSEQLVTHWQAEEIERFNLGTADFWDQVLMNYSGKRDTWAIFWYATIFKHGGLCLNPARTLAQNIGHDGSGENCGHAVDRFWSNLVDSELTFPLEARESMLAVERVAAFYASLQKKSLKSRISNFFFQSFQ
jgi:hypothetical protein